MNLNPLFYQTIFIFVSKIGLLIGLCWVIYLLLTYKKPISRDKSWYIYKIYNFTLNKIFIAIYMGIFIVFFTYLRIKRISLSLDLNIIISKFNHLPLSSFNRIFLLCSYILLVLIFILLIGKVNQFFLKEIKKLHLYSSYITVEDGRATYSSYHNFYFKYYANDFSYTMVIAKITGNIIRILLLINRSIDRSYFINFVHLILKLIPILLIPFIFMYDCYFNHLVITKLFYYLLFYMFYNIWYRISTFFWYEEHSYGSIIYEVYYCTNKISYCNVPEELEDILLQYMKKGLYNVNPSMLNMDHDEVTPYEYALEIKKHRFFSEDGKKFSNEMTGEWYMIDNPELYIPKGT